MKIYLAGPLFTQAERIWNLKLAEHLRFLEYEVFLPQDEVSEEWSSADIFAAERAGVAESDAVVAIMDGADPDSGTCWECGYAFGQHIPVVTVRTDFRSAGDHGGRFNLMLSESAWGSVELVDSLSLEAVASLVDGVLSTLPKRALREEEDQRFGQPHHGHGGE